MTNLIGEQRKVAAIEEEAKEELPVRLLQVRQRSSTPIHGDGVA